MPEPNLPEFEVGPLTVLLAVSPKPTKLASPSSLNPALLTPSSASSLILSPESGMLPPILPVADALPTVLLYKLLALSK